MSRVRANNFTDKAGTGAPTLPYGVTVTGVSTIGNVVVGGATTDVVINGDLRVTGIITSGTSSITIDPDNEKIVVGSALTLGHTQGVQFHTQNLHSDGFDVNNINASGIVTAANVSVGNSITATTFYGSGANLSGIDATQIQTGNTNVQTVDTGSDGHVKITTEGTERWRITSDGILESRNGSDIFTSAAIYGNQSYEVLSSFASNTIERYVSTSGNDSTGDGTSSSPYRGLNRALQDMPIARSIYQTFVIRIMGTTYDAIGETMKGNRTSVGDNITNIGQVRIIADNGSGVTVNFNNGGWAFFHLQGLYFENISWSRTSGGQRLAFWYCDQARIRSSCSFTADGTNPGWSYLVSWFGGKDNSWEANITVGSTLTAGLGAIFTLENRATVSIGSNVTILKNGTKFNQAAIAVVDRSILHHAGIINNFHTGVRCGVQHYGNTTGGTVVFQSSQLLNLTFGADAYYDSHIRWYYVTNTAGTSTTYQVSSTSRYN